MSLYERIRTDCHALLGDGDGPDIVSPTSLALILQARYSGGASLAPEIAHASLEGLKQIARGVLSGRYNSESDESEAHQGVLFSGHLQTRYPIPRKSGAEPMYKLRAALTADERQWNVETLRKSAKARLAHADALEAEVLAAKPSPPSKQEAA
ncbi:hypothetical protein [Phenylobacterium sp.]|uniref:hypothetical protein n=1 Tax=Phenylobacterium sp. TaxID=1871053 RepID=UPI0027322791|nr:hypothetical protein [Phenylobacterium sp.]MDP1873678.1 hypothetical protein [Phenylobacterium sp.]